MAEPTFDCPDLDAFCLLDRLGLTVTGQFVGEDRTVLACRVVEPDDVAERSCWFARCGQLGVPRDTVVRRLVAGGVTAAHPAVPAQTGGVRPVPQQRREGHLSAGEREDISRGLAAGLSGRVIATRLGRPSSTVSREIVRNGCRHAYRAVDADALLVEDWSPQQIAARLCVAHPDEPGLRVSHETIYRDLYVPSRRCSTRPCPPVAQ